MRAMLAIVLSFLFVSDALSAKNDLQSVCARTNGDEKFVMKLEKDSRNVTLCSLSSYQTDENQCEAKVIGTPYLSLITDINKDKHYDVILAFSTTGPWRGSNPGMILLNCGNDTFIKVSGTGFTTIKAMRSVNNYKWLQFKVRIFNSTSDENELGDVEDYILKFDEKKFTYTEIKTGSIKNFNHSNFDLTAPLIMPNLVVPWGKFPANLLKRSE